MLYLKLTDEKLNNKLINIVEAVYLEFAYITLKDKDLYIQNQVKATISYHLDPKRFEFGLELLDNFYEEIHEGRYTLNDIQTQEVKYTGKPFYDCMKEFEPPENSNLISLIKNRQKLEAELDTINKNIYNQVDEGADMLSSLSSTILEFNSFLTSSKDIALNNLTDYIDVIVEAKSLSKKITNILSTFS